MSAFSDYTAQVNAALDGISTHLDGITGDVSQLGQQIADLQAKLDVAGSLSDDDKAAMQAIVDRANAINDKAAAADALTNPPAPPADPS